MCTGCIGQTQQHRQTLTLVESSNCSCNTSGFSMTDRSSSTPSVNMAEPFRCLVWAGFVLILRRRTLSNQVVPTPLMFKKYVYSVWRRRNRRRHTLHSSPFVLPGQPRGAEENPHTSPSQTAPGIRDNGSAGQLRHLACRLAAAHNGGSSVPRPSLEMDGFRMRDPALWRIHLASAGCGRQSGQRRDRHSQTIVDTNRISSHRLPDYLRDHGHTSSCTFGRYARAFSEKRISPST